MSLRSILTIALSFSSLIYSGCSPKLNGGSSLKGCFGDDCQGYVYTPGGPDGARLGQFSKFGQRGNVNGEDAWYAESGPGNRPAGCLSYGPYLPLSERKISYVSFHGYISGVHCHPRTGGCGHDYWSGNHGPKSNWYAGKKGRYTVDAVAAGRVFWSQEFQLENFHFNRFDTPGFQIPERTGGLELRVCQLVAGQHDEHRVLTSRDGSKEDDFKLQDSKLVLGIHELRIKGAYE